MKKLITSLVLGVFLIGLMSVALPMPANALSSEVIDDLRQETGRVGSVAYGETAGEGELLTTRIAGIIKVVLGFLGVILVVLVVYAGFLWMTAGGDSDQIKKAKEIIINAVIGLAITLSAYAITDFIIAKLITATA